MRELPERSGRRTVIGCRNPLPSKGAGFDFVFRSPSVAAESDEVEAISPIESLQRISFQSHRCKSKTRTLINQGVRHPPVLLLPIGCRS